MGRKKKSIRALTDGIKDYEERKKGITNAAFTDLESFLKVYLSESDPKKRQKLADEYKKRRMELSAFLKDNTELIAAETNVSAVLQKIASGTSEDENTSELSNLFEKIKEGLK